MSIKDMINQAYSKDASGFEATFNDIMASKMGDAIGAKFDSMYGGEQMELPLEEPEVEVDSEQELESE
jgi:hypothetical protein